MKRNRLSYRIVRQVEGQRVNALSKTNVVEHLSRVQAAMDGYHIKESRYVFNIGQSGASMEKKNERALQKRLVLLEKIFRSRLQEQRGT